MTACRGCGRAAAVTLFDLGPQALCNRFLVRPDDHEQRWPLAIGHCVACGLVQLTGELIPADAMRPRVDWITYREPEAHLDGVAETLGALADLGDEPVVHGITFKDDSLLARMRERRGARIYRLDLEADLGIDDPRAGVETIQQRLDVKTARRIARARGRADVVIARHILEHVHEPRPFIEAVLELAAPDGSVVIEVPDCTRGLTHGDASTVWEEHAAYFTEATFHRCLAAAGLRIENAMRVPNALEDLLVAVTRRGPSPAFPAADAEVARGPRFVAEVTRAREAAPSALASWRASRGGIALFGAGHLGCTFVDLLGLRQDVEFFVDDHPQKRGLFMPGSHLAIKGSAELVAERISLCLLSLAPESEATVIARNPAFVAAGGVFASIFPGIERPAGSAVLPFEAILGGASA